MSPPGNRPLSRPIVLMSWRAGQLFHANTDWYCFMKLGRTEIQEKNPRERGAHARVVNYSVG